MDLTLRLNQVVATPSARVELTRAVASRPFPNDSTARVSISDAAGSREHTLLPGATVRVGTETFILNAVDAADPANPTVRFSTLA